MKSKITFVDDKPEIRKLVEVFFKDEFGITTLSNGLELIVDLRSGNIPDIIVLDIEMPGLNGKETLKELKSNSFYKFIPVIILSSLDGSSDRINMLTDGAHDYVIKPFNPQELKIRIQRILQLTPSI